MIMKQLIKNRFTPRILSFLTAACFAVALCQPNSAIAATVLRVGTLSEADQVNRIAGADRYETAVEISKNGWIFSDYAVLCSGNDKNLVDALTAAPLAKAKKAPILLTEGGALTNSTREELIRLGVKTVYVTSGSGVITNRVLADLRAMNMEAITLGGYDRYETAVNIAKAVHPTPGTLVLATANSNADALSIAAIAAAKGYPILLTDFGTVPASVKIYIDSVKPHLKQTYVLGGKGIISDLVKDALPNPKRLAGPDRFGTNLEILKEFAGDYHYNRVYLANGTEKHLVDALAGSPLAALTASVILLTDKTLPAESETYAKQYLSPKQVALGGEIAIPSQQLTQLAAAGGNSAQLADSIRISGKYNELKNVKIANSLYVQESTAYLENIMVGGTIFLDPGPYASVTLKQVKAGKIVVISGSDMREISLNDVSAKTLIISGTGTVRVDARGTTQFTNTVVQSPAILNAVNGRFGPIRATNISSDGGLMMVRLRGEHLEPIRVEGGVALQAAQTNRIDQVEVALERKDQQASLEGNYNSVQVNSEGKVSLASQTIIERLTTLANADFAIPADAKVKSYTDSAPALKPGTGIAAGTSTETKPQGVNRVSGIEILHDYEEMVYLGRPFQMKARITPANAVSRDLEWSVHMLYGSTIINDPLAAQGEAVIDPVTGLLVATEVGTVRVIARNGASGVSGQKDISLTKSTLGYQDEIRETFYLDKTSKYGAADGIISGTTKDMEYRLMGSSDQWQQATGISISNLKAGTYKIRYAEKTGFNPGPSTYVTVEEGPR